MTAKTTATRVTGVRSSKKKLTMSGDFADIKPLSGNERETGTENGNQFLPIIKIGGCSR